MFDRVAAVGFALAALIGTGLATTELKLPLAVKPEPTALRPATQEAPDRKHMPWQVNDQEIEVLEAAAVSTTQLVLAPSTAIAATAAAEQDDARDERTAPVNPRATKAPTAAKRRFLISTEGV